MADREMTLGEEIINLVEKGVDVPTVERMYRKYFDLNSNKESNRVCEEYCKADVEALSSVFHVITPEGIAVGDQIEIPLGNLGTFTATAQVIIKDKVLFLFDDYVAERPMNKDGGNAGGYSKSDLKKWIDTELYNMFPAVLKQRMTGLTIPTLGEICGWGDNWDKEHIEPDYDEQLPLMKQRRNRVAYYNNDCVCGWLRNAAKKEFSSIGFACVDGRGDTDCSSSGGAGGVRPEFWLYV